MRYNLGLAHREAQGSEQSLHTAETQFGKTGTAMSEETVVVEEMSEAQKDIAAQLQRLRGNSP